jgi:hypothetical protein
MRRVSFLLLLIVTIEAPTALGAVTDEDFERMRQQIAMLSDRLDALAAENTMLRDTRSKPESGVTVVQTTATRYPDAAASSVGESWSDTIRMDGDFRYRHERIDVQEADLHKRSRIRARSNIRADIASNIEVGFGLATGGDDPVSTNQTLGSGGSSKNIALNLAYTDWEALEGLHLIAGKYKNPLTRVGGQALMWDDDWTPEGVAVSYQRDWFFADALGTWLESDTKKSNDSFSWGGQIGAKGEIGGMRLSGGLGYYSIQTKGKSTTFGDPGDPRDYFGNSAVETGGLACGTTPDTDCVYLYDYLLTEVFAEANFQVGDWPTSVFFDYVNNSDPDNNNTGWAAGAKIGQAKDRGQMQFSWFYADKEADSLFGLLTDSDFAGGGTDNKGHRFKLTYGVNESWAISAQYFINEFDVSTGNKRDYDRLMIDTQWRWK